MIEKQANTIDLAALEAEFQEKSTADLRLIFSECAFGLIHYYARAAICVKVIEGRGERVQHAMLGTFRRIASGQTLPEVVAKFTFSPILNEVTLLPLPDQRRLAENPVIPVVEESGDTRMVDVSTAPAVVARRAVTRDGVLEIEEQKVRAALERNSASAVAKKTEPEEPLTQTTSVKWADWEYQAIAHEAIDRGITVARLIRDLTIKGGGFKKPK